jgi:hypothetical protein
VHKQQPETGRQDRCYPSRLPGLVFHVQRPAGLLLPLVPAARYCKRSSNSAPSSHICVQPPRPVLVPAWDQPLFLIRLAVVYCFLENFPCASFPAPSVCASCGVDCLFYSGCPRSLTVRPLPVFPSFPQKGNAPSLCRRRSAGASHKFTVRTRSIHTRSPRNRNIWDGRHWPSPPSA